MVIRGSIENFSRKRICELKGRPPRLRAIGAGRKDIVVKGLLNGIAYIYTLDNHPARTTSPAEQRTSEGDS